MTTLVAGNELGLTPNPWRRPSEAEPGFTNLRNPRVDARVVFHRDSQVRTIYLVLDETAAPLNGVAYVLEIGGFAAAYLPFGVPLSVDELLTAWALDITNQLGPGGTLGTVIASAERVAFKNPEGEVFDAIQVTAIQSPAVPGNGMPAGGTYATFAVGAGTSGPALAQLYLVREVDSASLAVHTRNAAARSSEVTANLNAGITALVEGWAQPQDRGALPPGGYAERYDMASQLAGFLQLYAPAHTDDAIPVVAAGDGVYGVVNLVAAYLAPLQIP